MGLFPNTFPTKRESTLEMLAHARSKSPTSVIAPLSLIMGFFNPDIGIYETHNTGWWYDFGYYMAIISGFGTFY